MNLSFRQTFVKMIMVGNAGKLHNRKQLLCNVSNIYFPCFFSASVTVGSNNRFIFLLFLANGTQQKLLLMPQRDEFGKEDYLRFKAAVLTMAVANGGQWCPPPHLNSVPSHFMFDHPNYHEAVELLCAVSDSQ